MQDSDLEAVEQDASLASQVEVDVVRTLRGRGGGRGRTGGGLGNR